MNKPHKPGVINAPNTVKHSYTQTIRGIPEQIFPLLCPVRERDWVAGWTTDWVISKSGVAEQDCIFQTPPNTTAHKSMAAPSIWIISQYNPESLEIEMIKVTPEHTVGKLQISLTRKDATFTCVNISYRYTSLSLEGDQFLKTFTESAYLESMLGWESAMNDYLSKETT